ncbi:hypothetical protein BN948_01734 [Hydrogenophaga intermedia]|uniref:Uncharacterized protein n=1 Tax=Hydrogenophaga intermedia TaxID=65786 RepID=A0A1L1PET9_HYDIT|nr:hypothetical protein [Hydrogenophaga intermedia]CDN87314.1 hypothetical protein BN948_01734 [Hydrogenophaga intermedia]
MIITATSQPLRVDYRVQGKTYSENMEGDASKDTAEGTVYPFDSKEVAPGEAYPVPGNADVLRIVRLGGAAQPNAQDAA